MPDTRPGLLERLERFGTAAENAILVLLLSATIVISVAQIVLREVFGTGLIWADETVRLMVLWLAMIGAIAASRDDRHLRIDILSHTLSGKPLLLTRFVVEIFAAFICAVIAWHSVRWLQIEIEYEDTVLVGFPAWIAHGVLPLAFGVMTYRFSLSSIKRARHLFSSDGTPESS